MRGNWHSLIAIGTMAMVGAVTPMVVLAQDNGAKQSGVFRFSGDVATAAAQRTVKAVVERYQSALNAGDFPTIRSLFADDAVAEWNTKQTIVGAAAMEPAYTALFKTTTFSTDFQYDAVDIRGDMAIVRTHHPVGQTETNKQTGAQTLDFNREIFILQQSGGAWKIVLYTFTAQPKQGEQ